MLKIGHRGAQGYAPENTIASFQKALEIGCDMIELDVHVSKDGKPMVIHDSTVNRTTSGCGAVIDFTYLELKLLGIPSLQEVMVWLDNRCDLNIELKTPLVVQPVIDLLQNPFYNPSQILISSFDWKLLHEIRSQIPKQQIGVLTKSDWKTALAFAVSIQAESLHPKYSLLTHDIVHQIHNHNLKIYTWTVNDNEDINFMKSLRVDGIISDFPDKI